MYSVPPPPRNHGTTSLRTAELPPATIRLRRFVLLLAAAAGCGVLWGISSHLAGWGAVLFFPAYVAWILSDMRVLGSAGSRAAFLTVVSLFPGIGLLIYLLSTRGPGGFVPWLAFCIALWIPGALAALTTSGVLHFARGEPW